MVFQSCQYYQVSLTMDIYEEILSALQTEDRVMLATIISTSGSTPACALSKMLVKQGGIVSVGTVGGGCMEGDVLLHANRLYNSGKAEVLTFHLNEDDAEHGLICGGSLDVLIEPVTKAQIPMIEELTSLQENGKDCLVATFLKYDGGINTKTVIVRDHQSHIEQLSSHISYPISDIPELIQRTFRRQETQRVKIADGELILEPVAGLPSLVIFGGGHVSKFVSRIAAMAGFRVTIIDDREKYANPKRFPEAAKTIVANFRSAFENVDVSSSTFLLIVTRGHEYDEVLLEQALHTPAKYIGMIGSKRKVLKAYEHLIARGVSVEELRRVHAPVGVDIGAVSAEEIAVSIVAQLINIRRGGTELVQYKSDSMKEMIHLLEKKPAIA